MFEYTATALVLLFGMLRQSMHPYQIEALTPPTQTCNSLVLLIGA